MTFNIICDTDYKCGYFYDSKLGYYYNNKFKYGDTNQNRDRSQTLKEYDFRSIFEGSKSKIANFLNPEWLKYLEDQNDNSLKENTLYFLKICETELFNTLSSHDSYCCYIQEKHSGVLFKIVLPRDVKREEVKRHVLNDSESFNFRGECTVTVNNQEEREMSVNDMITFVKTYKGTYRCYQIKEGGYPGWIKNEVEIKNKELLLEFLENLYLCYRMVEKRFDSMGCEYDSTTPAVTLEGYYQIVDQFQKSMTDYKNIVSNDIIKIYPIMKSLFKDYQSYLKCCMENRKDVIKGEITSEMINNLKHLNKRLDVNTLYTTTIGEKYQKFIPSFVLASCYGLCLNRLDINIQDKMKVTRYIKSLDYYIGIVQTKLYASGLKEIPWYEITPVKGDELIQQYTSELKEVKDQNVIKIYPVIVKLLQSFCSYMDVRRKNGKDFNLNNYVNKEILDELIPRLDDWTVIHCDNFILSEPYGWYSFDKEFKPLNSKLEKENEARFIEFLINLHRFFTKIEVKLTEAKYDKIYQHEFDEFFTYRTVCRELDKGIEEYQSRPKTDALLDLYPLIKKLYCCYTKYLSYFVKNDVGIDEGAYLPGSSKELKKWIKKLDSWNLRKNGSKWQEFVETKREEVKKENESKASVRESIMNQLKKHQNQHDEAKNKKINAVIEMMNSFEDDTAVVSFLMQEITKLNLDGDTNELVDKFNLM